MGVWRKVGSTSIPSGRRLVGCCWVFKTKRNGVYCTRLVAKGCCQIPSLDFTDNFSPVVNDVTFRVVLTQMLIEKWDAKIVDIDNAFLNGDIEHEIYMTIAEGYAECVEPLEEKKALRSEEAIYGLVQAARQFFKKIQDSLVQAGFKSNEADPCLVYKEDQIGVCIMLIYIDDMLIVENTEAVNEAIQILQQPFEVKSPTTLEDYLGVQVIKSKNGEKVWLGQPTIIKSLEKMFDEDVKTLQSTLTPGSPVFVGQKVVEDEDKVTEKEQVLYRSGMGTLLYLTRHSRPDITNAVRELSKSMHGGSKLQLRELRRLAKFVLYTKDLGLHIVPTISDGIWHLEALSDSDYANDKETRISVYEYILSFVKHLLHGRVKV